LLIETLESGDLPPLATPGAALPPAGPLRSAPARGSRCLLPKSAIEARAGEESRILSALEPNERKRLNTLLRKLVLAFEAER
jgi:hypothetical protein